MTIPRGPVPPISAQLSLRQSRDSCKTADHLVNLFCLICLHWWAVMVERQNVVMVTRARVTPPCHREVGERQVDGL